ncbi:reverse transcriptase [Tanacetum coccineum]
MKANGKQLQGNIIDQPLLCWKTGYHKIYQGEEDRQEVKKGKHSRLFGFWKFVFLEDWDLTALWKMFSRYGKVVDVYITFKRTKRVQDLVLRNIRTVKAILWEIGKILEIEKLDFDAKILHHVKTLVLFPNMSERRTDFQKSGLPLIRLGPIDEEDVVHIIGEKLGFSFRQDGIFHDFLSRTGLFDLPLGGRRFTRFDKDGRKASKLDKFLVSSTLVNKTYTPLLTTPKHPTSTNRNTTYHAKPPTTQLALPSTLLKKTSTTMNTPQKRQLIQKEYEEKKSKNVCFYYDQKYVPGHKCSGQLFSIIVLADDEVQESIEEVEEHLEEEVIEEPVIYPYVSLNTLVRLNTFHNMIIKGHVEKQDHILVDSSSTHNFVDVQCAKKLGCEIRNICPLQIEVSGENQMMSTTVCKSLVWTSQGQEFKGDIMLLPLGGCDMVLGIQRLSTLGDIK